MNALAIVNLGSEIHASHGFDKEIQLGWLLACRKFQLELPASAIHYPNRHPVKEHKSEIMNGIN